MSDRFRRRCAGFLVAVAMALSGWEKVRGDAPPEPEDLRRGLVTTYRDNARPKPVEIVRLEPTIALALGEGEAAHPQLAADAGTVTWKGYLNVLRAGKYRFRVVLRGQFKLGVGGKEVLAAQVAEEKPALKEGPDVQLEAGVHPLLAEFSRPPGAARIELWWQSPEIRPEPLPFDVLGHLPAKDTAPLKTSSLIEHGRFLAEEANCIGCHRPADDNRIAKRMTGRVGPDLSQVGGRVHPGWIDRWLESPKKLRPGAAMPEMFTADEAGRVERYAVARYLASLGGPVPVNPKQPNDKDRRTAIGRGQKLYASVGCITCHGPYPAEGKDKPKDERVNIFYPKTTVFPLAGLGSKTTPEKLAEYLKNPLAVDPSGRMPHMLLQDAEARDLAYFLCESKFTEFTSELPDAPPEAQMLAAFKRVDDRAEELAVFRKLPAKEQWLDLGKRIVIDKGCNNCHTIAPGGKPFASVQASALEELKALAKHEAGCLADDASKRGKAPVYDFKEGDRAALRAFLKDGLTGAGSPTPAFTARLNFARFNCLACHNRDGEGGLSQEVVEQLRRYENAENAEAVSPPTLTGIGHKLRTPWLRQMLTGAGRARPWMGLRMPQFGEAHVGKLPEALAALEGTTPDDSVHKVELTAARIDAGRQLMGKNGFGCISCHDLAGIPNAGTRGPDLVGMGQRVRYDWYQRWLEQPQRMAPGTRMPSVFTGGKSLMDKVLGGKADAQAEAIWAYLSLGPTLPLPEGMGPPKGLVLTVEDKPVLLRTFMPEAGARAIAVGFPGGVSTAFDANTCRLSYAWSGNFLDASPVWDNRGGAPAKVLGARFWTAPAGCPVGVTNSTTSPDFAARAKNPAYGAPLPEGKLLDGPKLLHFDGYSTDKDGVPTFRYHLDVGDNEKVAVSEKIEALRSKVAAGVGRRFTLETPGGQTPWLLLGESPREPRMLDAKGAPVALDLKSGGADVPVAERFPVLPQDGDRAIVLTLPTVPEGSVWRIQREGATWQVLLRLSPAKEAAKVRVDVNVWSPYKDEPALLKELIVPR
jgi:mono/diheme cytochrome c family protein